MHCAKTVNDGFIDTVAQLNLNGSYGDAHTFADTGCEVTVLSENLSDNIR